MTQPHPEAPYWAEKIEPIFDELRNICGWYPQDGASDASAALKVMDNKFHQPRYQSYFDGLGLSIACFLYIDAATSQVHYAFFKDANGDDSSIDQNYMIGYQDHGWYPHGSIPDTTAKYERYRRTIDTLYYIHRDLQKDFQSLSSEFLPEFIGDLPIERAPCRAVVKTFDADIRMKFGVHYVPYGEMVVFLLLWRRLVRRIGNGRIRWDLGLWSDAGSPPEELLATILSGAQVGELRTGIGEDLRATMAPFDRDDGTDAWQLDLRALLLESDDHPVWGWLDADAMGSFQGFIAEIGYGTGDKVGISEALVDSLLADDRFCGLAPASHDIRELGEALRKLHALSRFPILPYYYWSAISRRPRSHAVVPVWASLTAPLKHPIETPIVGLAVIDVAPFEQIDRSYRPGPTKRYASAGPQATPEWVEGEEDKRLRYICSSLRMIAQPQIDTFYYNRIQDRNIRRDEITNIAGNLTHDAKNMVNPLANLLASSRPDKQKLAMAYDMVADIRDRLTEVAALSASAPFNLAEPVGRSKYTFIPLKEFVEIEFTAALMRFIFNYVNIGNRFLEGFELSVDGLDQSSDLVRGIARAIFDFDQIEDLEILDRIEDNEGDGSRSMYRIALSVIFSEIFENYLKHTILRELTANRPLRDAIRISLRATPAAVDASHRAADQPLSAHDLDIEFSPGESAVPKLFTRWAGLQSLSYAASKVGLQFVEQPLVCAGSTEATMLPFWSPRTGSGVHQWSLKNVALKRAAQ